METFVVAGTEIQLGPDPVTGLPTLRIQATPWGACLAQLLAEPLPPPRDGCYAVPHDHQLDAQLCDLVELFITARYAHPDLLQLRLLSQEV